MSCSLPYENKYVYLMLYSHNLGLDLRMYNAYYATRVNNSRVYFEYY